MVCGCRLYWLSWFLMSEQSTADAMPRFEEQLRLLKAENARLRASAAAALRREEMAEAIVAQLEEEALFLRRRSLYWHLSEMRRFFARLARFGKG